jgi:hypothetical protein
MRLIEALSLAMVVLTFAVPRALAEDQVTPNAMVKSSRR